MREREKYANGGGTVGLLPMLQRVDLLQQYNTTSLQCGNVAMWHNSGGVMVAERGTK
jgi:hypothetical protein